MTNSNDLLKIDTPENVTFDYDVAGIGSRFLAALIDTTIIILLQALLFGSVFIVARFTLNDLTSTVASWAFAIVGIISFIFFWGYYIFFEILWNGQTPGKRQVGLRVIRLDGTPVSASEVVIRNLVRIIDFLPSAYGVGVVTMFINSNSRRVGDLAANTIVVHDRAVSNINELSPIRISSLTIPDAQKHLPENFPVDKISEHELHIIEEFLTRRKDLVNSYDLAKHILSMLLSRLGLSADTVTIAHAEEILDEIYRARRAE